MANPRNPGQKNILSSYTPSKISIAPSVCVEWEPVVPLGPTAAFHVAAFIRGTLFIHGGITVQGSTSPSSQFYRLVLPGTLWQTVRAPGSPSLSHHAHVVLEDRYLVLIGGWDGKHRTADVHVYDTQEETWTKMSTSGFPSDAGLSSHTASLLATRDILIVGREGSLKIQRRFGDVFILSGNVASGKFIYKTFSKEATSRSGHTAAIVGSTIYIVGGRSDKLFERAQGFKGLCLNQSNVLDTVLAKIESNHQAPLTKLPCGRRKHVMATGSNCLLVHGGETFDGRNREPVGEMFLISLKAPNKFFKLNSSAVCRAGHACCVLPDKVLLHGGISGKTAVHSDLYQLKILM